MGPCKPVISVFSVFYWCQNPQYSSLFWEITDFTENTRKHWKSRFSRFFTVFKKMVTFPRRHGDGLKKWTVLTVCPKALLDKTVFSRYDSWRVFEKMSVFSVFFVFFVCFGRCRKSCVSVGLQMILSPCIWGRNKHHFLVFDHFSTTFSWNFVIFATFSWFSWIFGCLAIFSVLGCWERG